MERDVVVTGLGAVTSVGTGVDETWENVQQGVSGAGHVTRFDPDEYSQCVDLAAEVDFDPANHDVVDDRRMGQHSQYAIAAVEEALSDAGFGPSDPAWDPARVGVSIGSGIGGLPEEEGGVRTQEDDGRLSPQFMLTTLPNLSSGFVSIEYDAGGPNRSESTACAAGTHSIVDAVDDIRLGRADVMLAGGAEAAIGPLGVGGFGAMRALSTQTDAPETASRPFDVDRDGFVMSEGAGILVLESRSHAEERGADPLATVSGVGVSADASHPTDPHEDAWGLRRAMRMAMDDAGLDAEAVDLVNAHGTSTPSGDAHEASAIDILFEDPPAVTAPKSMLGHSLGASGAIEAVLSVLAIQEDRIPPTINHDQPDPECDVPVVTSSREASVETVMNNSAGFGGTNGVMLLETP